jgi:hypothetical protein
MTDPSPQGATNGGGAAVRTSKWISRSQERLAHAMRSIFGVLALLVIAWGGWFYSYASHRLDYLNGRNLRTLATMGSRVENSLTSAAQVLTSPIRGKARDSAAPFIPLYDHLAIREKQDAFPGRLSGPCQPAPLDSMKSLSRSRWQQASEGPPFCLHTKFVITDSTRRDSGTVVANAESYLGWIFREPAKARIFDRTFLLDESGRIMLQAGDAAPVLTRLDDLVQSALMALAAAQKKPPPSPGTWDTFRIKPGIIDVAVAGTTYRLFLAPCCGGSWQERPFVLAGLVSKSRFVLHSLKISISGLTIVSLFLVIVIFSWSFLKIRWIGPGQRVLPSDGLRLGLSSLLGTAFFTILALDLYAYSRYRTELDAHLVRLAIQVNENLTREMHEARTGFAALVKWTDQVKPDTGANLYAKFPALPDSLGLPLIESWALIDKEGMQRRKWSTDSYMQPRVQVKDRVYFREALARRARAFPSGNTSGAVGLLPADSGAYVFESIQSWTTGQRRVVLSAPYRNDGMPVAAVTLEMASVIGPVLPDGFGFAVIDGQGKVLFHSDAARNLEENFFIEADNSKDVRSAVLTRTHGIVNMLYGGAHHRAYVAPVPGQPWSLVTFRDKQSAWITKAEWVATSGYLVVLYALVLSLLGGLAVFLVPQYRAWWMWPDRRLHGAYARLIPVFVLLLLASLAAVLGLERDLLLQASTLLPLITVALTILHLERRDAVLWQLSRRRVGTLLLAGSALFGLTVLGHSLWGAPDRGPAHWLAFLFTTGAFVLVLARFFSRRASEPRKTPTHSIARPYLTVAALFLVLVAALPAVGFFRVAHDAHTEALVKHRQVQFAQALQARWARIEAAYTDDRGKEKSGRLTARLGRCSETAVACARDVYHDAVHGLAYSHGADAASRPTTVLVQRLLPPFRPQTSLAWRALIPDRTSDSAWHWSAAGSTLYLDTPLAEGLTLSSVLPGLWPTKFRQLLLLIGLVLVPVMLAVTWIVSFVTRRFFLIEVTDPLIRNAGYQIGDVGDTNLLVLCRSCIEEDQIQVPERFQALDLRPAAGVPLTKHLKALRRDVHVDRPVLVRHFEHRGDDPAATDTKLRLVDSLVHDLGLSVIVVASRATGGSPVGIGSEWTSVIATPDGPPSGRRPLESFVLVDAERLCKDGVQEKKLRWSDMATPGADRSTIANLIAAESRCDPRLREIWQGVQSNLEVAARHGHHATRHEMLDLLGERAERYYDAIWASCRPSERVVLGHIAEDALANEKDRRVLRRLLARGLIRREPEFRVMNETFRRYLERHAEEAEAQAATGKRSVWDAIRRPMLAVVGSGIVVLFVTQQDLWNAANAILLGLSAGIPAFVRVLGFFGGRSGGAAPPA